MKDLLCAECGKQFSNKTCLRIHSRVHTHERPYKCRECNKTFSQNSALYYHKRIHSGLKPFECNICHRTFHVKHNLKTHMVRHGGDRKFRCRLCPKAFALAQVFILTCIIWVNSVWYTWKLCSSPMIDGQSVRIWHIVPPEVIFQMGRQYVAQADRKKSFTSAWFLYCTILLVPRNRDWLHCSFTAE
jgi:hypothetical protein